MFVKIFKSTMLWLCVSILCCLSLGACDRNLAGKTPSFNHVDITGADYGKNFALQDVNGQTRTLQDYSGKVVVLFFGFTQCPDICPTTMTQLAQTMQVLGAKADRVQVLFVSVDPERDTPEVLKQYVPAFDRRFVGLTGTIPTINATVKDFKAFYQKVPGKTPQSYTVDHTAASYVFDAQGHLRLYVRHGGSPADLASDISQLM